MVRSDRRRRPGQTNEEEPQPWTFGLAASTFMTWAGIAVILWLSFLVSSWQLALVKDQIFCKKKKAGGAPNPKCWLPSDPTTVPYTTIGIQREHTPGPVERARRAVRHAAEIAGGVATDATNVVEDLGTIAKAQLMEAAERKAQKGGQPAALRRRPVNPLAAIDLDGWRPFDTWSGPIGWPYNWADLSDLFYLKGWLGRTEISSWSLSRKALLFYFRSINSLITVPDYPGISRAFRFVATLLMPALLAISIIVQPIVSFFTAAYGSFSTGLGFSGFFWGCLLVLPIAVITTILQHISLIGYLFLGPFFGSGKDQFGINIRYQSRGKAGGYLRIMQVITFILLSIGLLAAVLPFAKTEYQDRQNTQNN